MTYDFSGFTYLLPAQLKQLKEKMEKIKGNALLKLAFNYQFQGPLSRFQREIPSSAVIGKLASLDNPYAGILAFSSSLAYGISYKHLGKEGPLPRKAGPLLNVEMAFIRKQMYELLPQFSSLCQTPLSSIETLFIQDAPESIEEADATWIWSGFNAKVSEVEGLVYFGMPAKGLEIPSPVPESPLAIQSIQTLVEVRIGSVFLSVEEIKQLKKGDFLILNPQSNAKGELFINETPIFSGAIGMNKGHKVMRIQTIHS